MQHILRGRLFIPNFHELKPTPNLQICPCCISELLLLNMKICELYNVVLSEKNKTDSFKLSILNELRNIGNN